MRKERTADGDFRTRSPDPSVHHGQILDLTAKCFGEHGYWGWIDNCRGGYVDDSHYDWDASIIGVIDDEVVTHVGVWGYRMRIGSAKVRVGGLGAVSTHGRHRKQGRMAKTFEAVIHSIRRCGYDMSILFGIPDFYHRFGYVRAWASRTCTASVDDLPSGQAPGRLISFAPPREDTDRLYNRSSAGLTGTAVRPTYRSARHGAKGYRWTNSRGRTAGYVVVAEWRGGLHIIDSAGQPEDVLRAVAVLARRKRVGKVRFSGLHRERPLARQLRRLGCGLDLGYQRSGGAMVRVVNLASTLNKTCGELSRRLANSGMSGWQGRLRIAGPDETATLEIARGQVKLAEAADRRSAGARRGEKTRHTLRGGHEVAQLLIGTEPAAEVMETGKMRATGDAASLAEALFPAQHPMLSGWDEF